MTAVAEPLLVVEHLRVSYRGRPDVVAVDDVALQVVAGEVVALVGGSGAGKTTAALALVGLLPPAAQVSGSVRLGGTELIGLGDRAMSRVRGRQVGLVFSGGATALTPVYRVGAQVAAAVRLHERGLSRSAARARARDLLAAVDLPAHTADAYPHQLSGGMAQRVLIALATAGRPSLLVADEPTAALDVTTAAHVLDVLRRVREESGAALLLVTHDLGVVAGEADRVVVLAGGRVVEEAATDRLFAAPRAAPTAALLDAARRLWGPRPERPDASLPAAAAAGSQPSGSPAPPRRSGAEAAGPPALELVDVHRWYPGRPAGLTHRAVAPVRALDGLSLVVPAGRTLALVGESGAGKTTTLRLVLDLVPPQTGVVRVLGQDLATLDAPGRAALRAVVAPVLQDPAAALDPRMVVGDLVGEGLTVRGVARGEASGAVREALALVGLGADLLRRYPGELSGGQRQRVAVARALVGRPQLLLLDEPVSALDPVTRADVLDLVAGLVARLGLTCVVVSHDLAAVRRVADDVAVLHAGRVVEHGPVDQVLGNPQHACTQALLAAEPVPDPARQRARRAARDAARLRRATAAGGT